VHHGHVLNLLHVDLNPLSLVVVVLSDRNVLLRFQILKLYCDRLQSVDLYFQMFGQLKVFIVHRNLFIDLQLSNLFCRVAVVKV
jgi:hypothetical protein